MSLQISSRSHHPPPFFLSLSQAGSFTYISFLQLCLFHKTYFFQLINLPVVLLVFYIIFHCFYCFSMKFLCLTSLIPSILCVLSDYFSNIEELTDSLSLSLILQLQTRNYHQAERNTFLF